MTEVVRPEICPNPSLPDHAQEIVERMNRYGLQYATSMVVRAHDLNSGVEMLITRPDTDRNYFVTTERNPSALVRLHPFANGDTPWNRAYLQFLANATDGVAVALLAPSTKGSEYNLSEAAWDKVKRGDFSPIGKANAQALETTIPYEIESIGVMGWSQGGSLAPTTSLAAMDSFSVSGVALGDPTSVADRSLFRLFRDLTASNYSDLRSEIEKTGFDIALDGFRFTGDEAGDFWRTTQYLKDIVSKFGQNLDIARGLGKHNLADQIVDLSRARVPTFISHAEDSAVCRESDFAVTLEQIREKLDRIPASGHFAPVQPIRYPGNHAAGDNIANQYDQAVRALNVL